MKFTVYYKTSLNVQLQKLIREIIYWLMIFMIPLK